MKILMIMMALLKMMKVKSNALSRLLDDIDQSGWVGMKVDETT